MRGLPRKIEIIPRNHLSTRGRSFHIKKKKKNILNPLRITIVGQFSTSKFVKKILSDFVRIQSLGCELAGEIVNISQDRTSGLTSEMTENRKHREISRNILQEVSRSLRPGGRRSATLEFYFNI